jgi:hypothetical protein
VAGEPGPAGHRVPQPAGWFPFQWDFIVVHYALAYVVIGSVLLHVGIKLPDINYGLRPSCRPRTC